MYVRGPIQEVQRDATLAQCPDEHERPTADGALLSVAIDLASILPGELSLDLMASAVEHRKKLFVIRAGIVRGCLPTVRSFQFPILDDGDTTSVRSVGSFSPPMHPPMPNLSDVSAKPLADVPTPALSIFAVAPLSSVSDLIRLWSRNVSLITFIHNARHTPVILVLGKLWSWPWRCQYLNIPLGLIADVWLFHALNIAWWSIWSNVRSMASGGVWMVFRY